MMNRSIQPHGGRLISRKAKPSDVDKILESVKDTKGLTVDNRTMSDLEMIANGALSPLEGFMNSKQYMSVLYEKRLPDGLPWTIPITLPCNRQIADQLREGSIVPLYSEEKELVAVLELEERFTFDKEKEAILVYGTTDDRHPGVYRLKKSPDVYLGGKITLVNRGKWMAFQEYWLDPGETRRIFSEKGWKTIVGFQTRNPIHRAHEYIQKCALEIVDGLFIHPIIGETKKDDIPAEIRMKCYEILIKNYFPTERVILAVNPAYMRYAGPREAIFHAIVRKNYGCTHFIVGRDHAGVGNYYGPFDAQHIFSEFSPEELGITPLFFDNTFFCKVCGNMASPKTCPHTDEDHIMLSGTRLRDMLKQGIFPPQEITRMEIASILIEWIKMDKGEKDMLPLLMDR